MSILSDRTLKERIKSKDIIVEPLYEKDIQPCSIDLHLHYDLKTIQNNTFDLREEDYILLPNEFMLGCTKEFIGLPNDLSAFVDGKSSIGRLGIDIHKTAGFIDAGFKGQITLEIKNDSDEPFILRDNMSIGQIIFFTLTSPCDIPYGDKRRSNHYQDSKGTILSRYEY